MNSVLQEKKEPGYGGQFSVAGVHLGVGGKVGWGGRMALNSMDTPIRGMVAWGTAHLLFRGISSGPDLVF